MPADFYLWSTLKDIVYHRKLAIFILLQEETEMVYTAILLDNLANIAQAVTCHTNKCLEANDPHFM